MQNYYSTTETTSYVNVNGQIQSSKASVVQENNKKVKNFAVQKGDTISLRHEVLEGNKLIKSENKTLEFKNGQEARNRLLKLNLSSPIPTIESEPVYQTRPLMYHDNDHSSRSTPKATYKMRR